MNAIPNSAGPSLFVKDDRKGPVLRQSGMNFQTLNFRFLGLPPVGLGRGHNILVGEARRKKAQFFSFVTLGKRQNLT